MRYKSKTYHKEKKNRLIDNNKTIIDKKDIKMLPVK